MMTPEQQKEFEAQYAKLAETRKPGTIVLSATLRYSVVFRSGKSTVTLQPPDVSFSSSAEKSAELPF